MVLTLSKFLRTERSLFIMQHPQHRCSAATIAYTLDAWGDIYISCKMC
ncbi:MAG: hypothetical protein ACO31I_18390 [Prochlorotrichaceae cyanobacterium]